MSTKLMPIHHRGCATVGKYRGSVAAFVVVVNPEPCDCGLDALLAVAKAFDDRGERPDWYTSLLEAMVKLNTEHPGWREWA